MCGDIRITMFSSPSSEDTPACSDHQFPIQSATSFPPATWDGRTRDTVLIRQFQDLGPVWVPYKYKLSKWSASRKYSVIFCVKIYFILLLNVTPHIESKALNLEFRLNELISINWTQLKNEIHKRSTRIRLSSKFDFRNPGWWCLMFLVLCPLC